MDGHQVAPVRRRQSGFQPLKLQALRRKLWPAGGRSRLGASATGRNLTYDFLPGHKSVSSSFPMQHSMPVESLKVERLDVRCSFFSENVGQVASEASCLTQPGYDFFVRWIRHFTAIYMPTSWQDRFNIVFYLSCQIVITDKRRVGNHKKSVATGASCRHVAQACHFIDGRALIS